MATQTAEHVRVANVVAERDKKKARNEDGGPKFDPEQPILLVDTEASSANFDPITYRDLVKEIGPDQVAGEPSFPLTP